MFVLKITEWMLYSVKITYLNHHITEKNTPNSFNLFIFSSNSFRKMWNKITVLLRLTSSF